MTDEQLAHLARADAGGMFGAAVPTRMVSNGQYFPHKQTKKQQRVEARVKELAAEASRTLGMSRRQFLAGPGGLAASFLAMNDVFGAYFDVEPVEMFDAAAFAARGLPRDAFVFDTQLHVVAGSVSSSRNLRALAQRPPGDSNGNGHGADDEHQWAAWNPTLVGTPLRCDTYHIVQFVKDVFLDGGVSIGVLDSAIGPTADGDSRALSQSVGRDHLARARQAAQVRDFVNDAAGSRRLFVHGVLHAGGRDPDLIQRQIDETQPDSWKAYASPAASADARNGIRPWRMDDECVAYPAYQAIAILAARRALTHPGLKNICVHTGLGPDDDVSSERGHGTEIRQVARDWPQLNFLVYHSCLRPAFFLMEGLEELKASRLRNGVPDVRGTSEFIELTRELPNVYAELGTTWASTVITFPAAAAHMLGQMVNGIGAGRVLFGSDSVWYGSPRWQLEAFWRFRIPEPLRCQFGYPELTPAIKRDILGRNAARLYDVQLESAERDADAFSSGRQQYVARGPEPNNLRYGWIRM